MLQIDEIYKSVNADVFSLSGVYLVTANDYVSSSINVVTTGFGICRLIDKFYMDLLDVEIKFYFKDLTMIQHSDSVTDHAALKSKIDAHMVAESAHPGCTQQLEQHRQSLDAHQELQTPMLRLQLDISAHNTAIKAHANLYELLNVLEEKVEQAELAQSQRGRL